MGDALLVGVDVTDDVVVPAATGADPWSADSVEVYVDGRAPAFQYQTASTKDCYQIAVSPAVT